MNVDVLDELLSQCGTGRGADERTVGRLEGRESVYEYCRELADRATDELFLIYTSDELLDEESPARRECHRSKSRVARRNEKPRA